MQVIEILLQENLLECNYSYTNESDRTKFGNGTKSIHPYDFLVGRSITCVSFADTHTHLLLVAYSPSRGNSWHLKERSLLCIWDLNNPSKVSKVLICDGIASVCTFSSGLSSIVLCGTTEGTINLWDLREPVSLHFDEESARYGVSSGLRTPTYTTASQCKEGDTSEDHSSEIVKIVLLGDKSNKEPTFQIASLDDRGLLNIWVVMELKSGDVAGSEVDLGIGIGGKWKLSLVSSINVLDSSIDTIGPVTSDLVTYPDDYTRFLVGTHSGKILQAVRFGNPLYTKYFSPPSASIGSVTCLSASPFSPKHFIASFACGFVSIYSIMNRQPIISFAIEKEKESESKNSDDKGGRSSKWACGVELVRQVAWSKTRPCVFFVLESSSIFSIWDLKDNDQYPVLRENMYNVYSQNVLSFALSNVNSRAGRPYVSFSFENGAVVTHAISTKFTAPWAKEEEWLNDYFSKL